MSGSPGFSICKCLWTQVLRRRGFLMPPWVGWLLATPMLPKLGSTLITSLPKDHPHQTGWSHRLCWRFGVPEGAWPIQLLGGPFTASSPSSPFWAPHTKRAEEAHFQALHFLDLLKRAISSFPCCLQPYLEPEHCLCHAPPPGCPPGPPCSRRGQRAGLRVRLPVPIPTASAGAGPQGRG